jgi:hypothetical protein
LSTSNTELSKRKYEGISVYDSPHFSYAFCKGLFIACKNSTRVNEAIRQLNTESLIDNADFARINKTAGSNAKVNIYLNHNTFPRLISLCLDKTRAGKIKDFDNYATWTEVDLSQKTHEIMLNGFTFTDNSKNNYLNVFLNQEPLRFRMESILPAETSFFLSLNISNPKEFFSDYKKYLEKAGKYYDYKNGIIAVEKSTGMNAQSFIQKHLDGEVGIVYTRANPSVPEENRFLVAKTKSSSNAKADLMKMLNATAKKQNRQVDYYKKRLVIDKQTSFDIYKMPSHNFGNVVFGSIFNTVATKYFTFIGNHLVMGDSFRSVSGFIRANVLQEVLGNDKYYRDFANNLSQKSNLYLWMAPGRSHVYFSDFLSKNLGKSLAEKIEHLRKIESIGWQFGPENGMIYNTALIRYNPNLREKPQTVWQSHLENEISTKPQFVINHNDKANKEVVVQDKENNFYLINKVGRVQWKIKLSGAIMGEIHQIDYFKNGKLQYLFNTPEALHLIDRNGNYVDNYPVKLRAKATNGVAVFDYDNVRNYRFFVACNNNKIYLYDKKGRIVPGWTFGKTEHPVSRPIQHYRSDNKDYIVFFDLNRTYILDRKGNHRVKTRAAFTHSLNNDFTMEKGNGTRASRLVKTDNNGNVFYIYFNGSFEKKEIKKFSPDHYFRYEDIDADSKKDFIFQDNNKLSVFNAKGTKMFEEVFSGMLNQPPQVYKFSSNNSKIGVVNKKENRISLFNKDGALYSGFPLEGNSRFSIGFFNSQNQQFNLIVGSSEGFLYNYFVK